MKLDFKVLEDRVLATLSGELDTAASAEIQQGVDSLLENTSKTVIIDCAGLSYIASSGLRQLIFIYKKCKADGGHLTLENVCPEVMEIFKVTNFDKVFDIKSV